MDFPDNPPLKPHPSTSAPSLAEDGIRLIDAIGPFFRACRRRTINWSKIPFQYLDLNNAEQWQRIREDLRCFASRVSALGFNAASLDDVAHLADHEWYDPEERALISRYREEFRRCFQILREAGLAVFVTMDHFTSTDAMRERMRAHRAKPAEVARELISRFLDDFSEVSGVILRIGEADGRDVADVFRSELCLRDAREANAFLKTLLPVFEKHGRKLVFRTWTVGAFRIGDLMWHRDTFARVLEGITSNAIIVSMKHGESDFFRYLPVNRNFFRTSLPKMVELQARREYEGCGEYPSFVGWEHERILREVRQADNVIGCMVWCQTGGWVPFRRLAFIDGTAMWTELNTHVTLRLFRDGALVEDAVREFATSVRCPDPVALLELLRLSDEAVRGLLYIEEFARQKLFFRRVRIPPLLQVYWHNIFISHGGRRILRHFVRDHEGCLRTARRVLDCVSRMRLLAARAGVPVEDIEFMEHTFRLMALAREYLFADDSAEMIERIRAAKRAYKQAYPKSGSRCRYRVKLHFEPLLLRPRWLRWGLGLLLRRQRGYRLVDRIVTLHLLSLVYRLISKRRPHWIPGFARDSAMGVDVLFR